MSEHEPGIAERAGAAIDRWVRDLAARTRELMDESATPPAGDSVPSASDRAPDEAEPGKKKKHKKKKHQKKDHRVA